MERVTVIVHDLNGKEMDVEVPLDISAKELVVGLHTALKHAGPCPGGIRCENPVAYLHGDRPLEKYNLRDGSNLYFYGDGTL